MDDIFKRETFPFHVSLCFLQLGMWGGHFQWSFQVCDTCGGVEMRFLPLGTCTHVTLMIILHPWHQDYSTFPIYL